MTEPGPLQQLDRTYVRYRGRKLSYFGGCDYFRLASHPEVLAAVAGGLKRYGLNVAASRLTTGNHALYGKLEARLARFFSAESALLVSNGYVTNLVVAQALADEFDHALIDAKAHLSLLDAAAFLQCRVTRYKHRDAADFARAVRACGKSARIMVLTDGMFSNDGSIAPLGAYLKHLPRGGLLLVDDAHGGGTVGRRGRGSVELEGVSRERLVQTVTLSKAFGVYGGAILCRDAVRRKIIGKSRLFVGNTPLPLPLANAALRAVELLARDKELRRRLDGNIAFVKTALRQAGLAVTDSPAPIITVAPLSGRQTRQMKEALLARNIFPSFSKYPGGPAAGCFRFVLSSEHSLRQLRDLLSVLVPPEKGK